MKISVITPYDSSNFGAFLQAYCLKTYLEKEGHTVFHIPTRDQEYVKKLFVSSRKGRFTGRKQASAEEKQFNQAKYEIFRKAAEQFTADDSGDKDVYILGSDEIWNIQKPVFRKPIFWGEGRKKVIAYAPSIGNAEASEFQKWPAAIAGMKHLSAALVRDEKTAEVIRKYTQLEPTVVCDPTMLMPVSEWGESIEDPYLQENDCLLIYAYKLQRNEIGAIRDYARAKGMKTVACCFYHAWCDHQINCSPLQFSSLMQQCKAVFSGTFHGTIFSILNHRPVAVCTKQTKSRQLLRELELEKILIQPEMASEKELERAYSAETDWERTEAIIREARNKSGEALKTALAAALKEEPRFSYSICPYDRCTACGACMNACAQNAIEMVCDGYGSIHPVISESKCIRCEKCKRSCPVNNPTDKTEPRLCIAAQRKERGEWIQSASGGTGAALAETFFGEGGTVYGAVMGENGYAHHIKAKNEKDLQALKRSKYVHSDMGLTYREIKEDLRQDIPVLFFGTPCQVAGLMKYLGKRYDKLYTVDLICHGTPDFEYLRQHLAKIGQGKTISNVTFRGGEKDLVFHAYAGGQPIYSKNKTRDPYYKAFMERMSYRECCYQCQYACPERVSDMTIGDFWKIDRSTLKSIKDGRISLAIINSDKGEELFNRISEQCLWEYRDYTEARAGNPNLNHPSQRSKYRDRFLKAFAKGKSFDEAFFRSGIIKKYVKDYLRDTALWKTIRKVIKK